MAEAKKKNTNKKKTTTTKKGNSVKKNTTKKTTTKANNAVKKKTVKKIEKVKKEQVIPVKEVEIVTEETFNEKLAETQPILTITKEDNEVKEEPKLENIEVVKAAPLEPINNDVQYKNEKNNNKPIDAGILIVLVGMFVLVLITYITSAYNLNYTLTNILVGISLVIETIGIIIILVNLSKKN